ncbi:TRAP transporter substrate-binding protein DctP [Nitratireductor mangrovi]|uniref:TRAP transporter substrate-binding protein DctP n=1 Tax=Nitratireductor mangrovi TaxID=2599600 RepID=A0A5B8L358_9HYPH|nr:TRAP transporter substrate-binding protein DctP [Nitratireductor mangrovi]QDZ02283.2 TRAP transporter substrate-binding protein DctP [Nitratireductor mangrovi]
MRIARLVASLISVLGLTQAAAYAENYPEMNLRYSSNIPEVVNTSRIDTYFSSEIEKRSGGAIKIQHFWANTLGGEAEIVDLVGSGAIDLGLIVMGNQAARMPFAAVTNALPFTFTDGPTLNRLTADIFANNPTVKAELDAANLHPLLFRYLPDYRVYCNDPIKTMDDFKSRKIRSYGAFVPVMFESLGAVPVNIPPVDMIQAMQSGAMDCTYMFNSAVKAFKIDQVAKYGTDISFGVISAHTLFVSKEKWESWPANVRALFEEVAADAEQYGNELIAADEAKAVEALQESKMEIVPFEEMDKLKAAVPDMLDVWVKKMDEAGKGEEAKELADHIRAQR